MKKLCVILAAVLLLCMLAACGGEAPPATAGTTEPTTQSQQNTEEPTWTGVLYGDFSCGSAEDVYIQEYPFEYSGVRKSAEELAAELSKLTGMDFTITAAQASDGWVVDWSPDSTLIAGLDDREQKEDFFFYDIVSLRWFMLDSLWRTLSDNLDAENIYYTMNGGEELSIEDMHPVNVFPSDIPYMGSAFYYAHEGGSGEEEDGPFARTKGLWHLDGALDTASIEMDGFGGFTAYHADGTVEARGYLDYVDEYGDGNFRYDMYSDDGQWLWGFYFDSDTQIHMGNGEDIIYQLDGQEFEEDVPNTYYDASTGLLLTYPNVFSSEGMVDDNGMAIFYTLWNTGMCYWIDPNDAGLSPSEFRELLPLTESMELDGNVVIGYGELEDEYGEMVPAAYYWVVDIDFVVNVMILCSDPEEPAYWYGEFQNQAFYVENAS